ncbi:MAG: DUF1697 domain-containing protein [Acidobacteriia bacterium]|nr:DUF1697 domain-containing protein [Terriglobia bacterium]
MPEYICFLRAINVGGHTVKMEELRAMFISLGFQSVDTFIASGNVIFQASQDPGALEKTIEAHLHLSLGYEVAAFLRTRSEVAAIARYKPFPEPQLKSAAALNVVFLSQPLRAESRKALMALRTAIDEFQVHGREVYWLCRKKQSKSTFSNVLFERTLKIRSTFRGIKTVEKLAAKYPDPENDG